MIINTCVSLVVKEKIQNFHAGHFGRQFSLGIDATKAKVDADFYFLFFWT